MYRPSGSQEDLAPSGAKARTQANFAAIRVLQAIDRDHRPATAAEQDVLARWGSWGAVPDIFDVTKAGWADERTELQSLIDQDAYSAASRTTMNAHYTDPALVTAIWNGLAEFGFTGGDVLEPGCGAGTFIGLAPKDARMIGVEWDPTTAKVAAALYPNATILSESFADTKVRSGSLDAAIGNVPYGDVVLHDPRHNVGNHSIHNHFILKSLDLVRPGGFVAVLTSRYTMDATNPAARREMNAAADLVAAVRLPNNTHRRAAGTTVVSDLLVFQVREPSSEPADRSWESTRLASIDDEQARINNYFLNRPMMVLGSNTMRSGEYASRTLGVHADDVSTVSARLAGALHGAAMAANTAPIFASPARANRGPLLLVPANSTELVGSVTATDDGQFTVYDGYGVHTPFPVPKGQGAETRMLLVMRDQIVALQKMEAASLDEPPAMDQLRAGLAKRYAAYVLQYGPINRFTERRGVPDENGEVSISRTGAPAVRRLRTDPRFARVTALELFNPQTQVAKPAGVLSERQITVRRPPMGADTADDALNICMDTIGAVDLPQIARLLGVNEPEARVALGHMVFHDPAQDKLVLAAEYLSGNVRVKLTQAREGALTDPTLAVNVAALVEAQPQDLGPGEIEARLGAVWISPDMHRAFLAEILGDRSVTVANPTGNTWFVEGNRWSVAATSEWGTDRRHALDLVTACMEQREIKVLDPDPVIEGRRILNPEATIAAQDKVQALQARFAEWVWEDPARAEVLVAEYNARFNSLVPRDYASAGATLTLPGLARSFTPYPHQRSAVARILAEPAAGLFHEVGAGKTAEICMAVMEAKRLGKATKPVVVVPNHMLEQFAREWLQLYPQANLLAASSDDLSKDNRRQFVAKVAMNDWDAVIMTRGAFKRIEVSPDAQKRYEQRAVVALRADLEVARAGGTPSTVKKMERKLLAAEQNLKRKLDSVKDPGITFEETGIDLIVVDELHDFKNLKTLSAMQGMNTDGSQMAQDLHMKVELLREKHPGRSVFVGATATPIANSIAEAHVMMRYMRPDLLAACGTLNFDSWAATFGKQVTEVEMDPTGAGFRQKTRLAQFTNVPEMMQIWGVFGDVKTAADLQLDVPKLQVHSDTGVRGPVTIGVPRSTELAAYIATIGERAERIARRAVRPDEDNMLKVSTDGRHAALDMRLVGDRTPIRDGSPAKTDVVAEQIARIWAANSDRHFDDVVTGDEHPTPGGLQLVFCDLSTPKNDGSWNVYDELRDQLVAYGILPDQIRAIHQAKNDTAKAQMFADAREGRIAVLMGSTQKMGVGTNIQARAVALHHVDCPWRPADIAQRDGRIIRQGNQNPEVGIYRYVTTGSFDAYMWQTVERKSKFIAQVLAGRPNARAVDDLTSGDTLSAGEAKALASGNPLMADKVAADVELSRLSALSTSHARNSRQLDWRITSAMADIASADADLPKIQAAAAVCRSTTGDAFAMTVADATVYSRTDAAEQLRHWAQTNVHRFTYEERDLGPAVSLGGVTFTATELPGLQGKPPDVQFRIEGVPRTKVTIPLSNLMQASLGPVTRLENEVRGLPGLATDVTNQRHVAEQTHHAATAARAMPFKHANELAAARAAVTAIDAELDKQSTAHAHVAEVTAQGPTDRATSDDRIADIVTAEILAYVGTEPAATVTAPNLAPADTTEGTNSVNPPIVSPSQYGADLGQRAREAERCQVTERALRATEQLGNLAELEHEAEPVRAIGYAEHDRAQVNDVGQGVC